MVKSCFLLIVRELNGRNLSEGLKLPNFLISACFFVLNTNLTSVLKYFLSLLFKNPFFCNFWGKNELFGYLEYTVVAWLHFLVKPNKN